MTLVNFGFSTLLLSLLSEACYSWGIVTLGLLKRVLHMGTSENKIMKNVKCEKWCISWTLRVMNRNVKSSSLINLRSVWHLICSRYLSYLLFSAKREIIFEVSSFGGWLLSGGLLLSGFANTCDILSLFSEVQSCWTYAISRQGIELTVTLFSSYQAPGGIAWDFKGVYSCGEKSCSAKGGQT